MGQIHMTRRKVVKLTVELDDGSVEEVEPWNGATFTERHNHYPDKEHSMTFQFCEWDIHWSDFKEMLDKAQANL